MVVETIKALDSRKTVILGAFGMLGHELQKAFPYAIAKGRDLDITNRRSVRSFLQDYHPEIVINAAAYTDVDGCEDNREHAFAVNGEALEHIATACADINAILIHYSTDYVFDGSKKGYIESDEPHPINAYGESKLLGEQNIQKSLDEYRIIRTSWLFGKHGKNFVDTILRLSVEMPAVKVVENQFGKPTYAVDLAYKTREIITLDPGIYHITNDGICSWYEFASAFIDNAVPCSSDEFSRKARRPKNSVLINTRTAPMRHWKESLEEYLMPLQER
jgi:dTDP-4-dehydrorhamnose reductase